MIDYGNPRQARQGLSRYFDFYNQRRVDQALEQRTHGEVYSGSLGEALVHRTVSGHRLFGNLSQALLRAVTSLPDAQMRRLCFSRVHRVRKKGRATIAQRCQHQAEPRSC